jgi:hypothetical protein
VTVDCKVIRVSLELLELQVVREIVVQVDLQVNLDHQATQEPQVPQVPKELRVQWVRMGKLGSQAKSARQVPAVCLVPQDPRDCLEVQVQREQQDVPATSDLRVRLDLPVLWVSPETMDRLEPLEQRVCQVIRDHLEVQDSRVIRDHKELRDTLEPKALLVALVRLVSLVSRVPLDCMVQPGLQDQQDCKVCRV